MNKRNLTDLALNNKTAMNAHLTNSIVMLIFCLLQAAIGLLTWAYIFIVSAIGFAPIIIEYYLWKKDQDSPLIKHLVAVGFLIFYSVILFTAAHSLVFVFIIPIILVVSVYNDARYTILLNAVVIIENLLACILGATTGKVAYGGSDSAIIQVVIMILIAVYSYFTAKTLNRNSTQKIQRISEAQNQTETVLSDLSRLSEQMKTGIERISYDLSNLDDASNATKNAMQEVSTGATETAHAVEGQLLQTEAIQNKVDMVSSAASCITDNMEQTLTVLDLGKNNVEALVEKVEVSVSNSEDAAKKLKTLNQYMEEMNSIVELISGITSQTSLLALNASIEAARAGEAGRGFSVVATEISGMATQTKDATAHITKLIENVTAAISEVVDVIYHMISGITEEKEAAANTSNSFSAIQTNTYSIRDNVDQLISNIEELKAANQVITESIQTISAVSEEVSAHASETMHAEIKNAEILTRISAEMQYLVELTK